MWVEAILELGPKLAIEPYLSLIREGAGWEMEGLVLKSNISSSVSLGTGNAQAAI